MDFELPADTLMLRDMLRRFIRKEAQPLEMKYFTAGQLMPEERARLQRAVEQMGLWGLTVPEAYGGGLDLVSACVLDEVLVKTVEFLRALANRSLDGRGRVEVLEYDLDGLDRHTLTSAH